MYKIVIVLLVSLISIYAQEQIANPDITTREIQEHVNYLASDALEGRFTGSAGEKLAGEYIAKEFRSYGLLPLFGDSYFQKFPFIESVELTSNNYLKFTYGSSVSELTIGEDFSTVPFSGNMELESDLVFTGYGISTPMFGYDDYRGLDVNGKIVLVMMHHPEYDSASSKFEAFASLRSKAATARDKGAAGIIFVNENAFQPRSDEFVPLKYDGAPAMKDFAVMQISKNYVEKLFESADKNYTEVQKEINSSLKPASLSLNVKVELTTEIKEIKNEGRNIVGFLAGNDPELKNQYIVVGAHYDHLGYGQTGSRYTGHPMPIHNGADDNASGTAGVLELAEKLASVKNELKRSIIFVAFSGEELGLLGSTFYVNNFPYGIEKTVAMINMDMIGRVTDNSLTIIGSGTSSIWKELINKNNNYAFDLKLNDDGWGGSDHTAFTLKNIPVLFFFSGIHSDYHMPGDDPQTINAEREKDVVKLVSSILSEVDSRTEKLDFVEIKPQERPSMGGRPKVKIGTVPEFGYNGEGYKISGVTEGSAAEKGGLLPGDIIIKFNGKDVSNIYDFMSAMSGLKEGDSVHCTVKRGDEVIDYKLGL